MIRVEYVCKCGNRVMSPPQKPFNCVSKGGYEVIDKNLMIICGDCGKEMKITVTKETTELKTEIIRKEQ